MSVVVAVGLGLRLSSDETGSAAPGTALDKQSGFAVRPARQIPVGQQFVYNYMLVENVSEKPLTLLGIRPILSSGFGKVAHVEQLTLGRSSAGVPWARYLSYPPVTRNHDGVCEAVELLDPSEDPLLRVNEPHSLIVRLRAVAQGRAVLKSVVIAYRSDGVRREQTIPFEVRMNVSSAAPKLKARVEEKDCAAQLGSELI